MGPGPGCRCFRFTGIGPEAESNPVTLRIKYGIIPKKVVFIPIGLRNQKWERIPLFWHATVGHSVAPEFIMPPRRTGFNEYMPQGQRTLTEVDGVVEIGPVGPATQKEVAPAQANTSRKRDRRVLWSWKGHACAARHVRG